MEFATIPAIVAVVAFICQLVKKTSIDNKWLPIIAGIVGAVIGFLAFSFAPEYIAIATNATHALIIGAASGLAATGAHQVIKQAIPTATVTPPETPTDTTTEGKK
jgi:uncharacterized membrane protein HdeD (DUF308 family)